MSAFHQAMESVKQTIGNKEDPPLPPRGICLLTPCREYLVKSLLGNRSLRIYGDRGGLWLTVLAVSRRAQTPGTYVTVLSNGTVACDSGGFDVC